MATLTPFQVFGNNANADFTLKIHRGEGMALLAMNWKNGAMPPLDFVGFAIEYQEPGGNRFYALNNRIGFPNTSQATRPSLESPFQKFRWVHFPRNADLTGDYTYRVTPMFMDPTGKLTKGASQQAGIALYNETYPGELNVTFTRGFVSSQAFVDYYGYDAIRTLLPAKADLGLDFDPTHPKREEAYAWMGFEARREILKVLSEAIKDTSADVYVVAYDLSCSHVVDLLVELAGRLKIIIDNSPPHNKPHSGETIAASRLIKAGAEVLRQKMGQLQHNKTIIVKGNTANAVVCGSTNYSWRGLYVQANNALVIRDKNALKPFLAAFDAYWDAANKKFRDSTAAEWQPLSLPSLKAEVAFSPHSSANALLGKIAGDVKNNVQSSLLFSLAFLYQTDGLLSKAVKAAAANPNLFVYGISDKPVGGINVLKPDGKLAIVSAASLSDNVPKPFKLEPSGGMGTRMHHKFLVLDFNLPTARVYTGSYNFSDTADLKNGENLLLIKDERVATSYAVEALHIFDHYHYRVARKEAKKAGETLSLAMPAASQQSAWWFEDYQDPKKRADRILFSS